MARPSAGDATPELRSCSHKIGTGKHSAARAATAGLFSGATAGVCERDPTAGSQPTLAEMVKQRLSYQYNAKASR